MKRAGTLAAFFLSASLAQAQSQTLIPPAQTPTTKLSAVMGSIVMLQNEPLGKVADVVVGDHGTIEYVVVNYGSDYLAVPWSAVRYDARQQTTNINGQVSRAQLRSLAFAPNNWPSIDNREWMTQMRSVWGANAFAESRVATPRPAETTATSPGSTPKASDLGIFAPGVDNTKSISNGVNTNPRSPGSGATGPATTGGSTTGTDLGTSTRSTTTSGKLPTTPAGTPKSSNLGIFAPGVDNTKNISNGVNTNPRSPGNGVVDPAATGGSTSGTGTGSSSREPSPRVPAPRPTDRP